MPTLPIRIYPDPVLKQVAEKVTRFNDQLTSLANDMAETMYTARGIGLAANQVGVLQRIAIVDVGEEQNERIDLVNPEIVWKEGAVPSEEGCLSIPDYRETVRRNKEIVVQAQDTSGKEFELKAEGLLAICIQHEIDHLNGILFIDHLSRLKRELFKRWLKKRASED
ncbi:MAG: peptide deformylase [Deltaproteobacteria bacterium]|nr:peptide deformylase [Deltaproteobacteria bacterium]